MLKHCFLVYEKHSMIFLALRHLVVCTKIYFLFLIFFCILKVFDENWVFNTGYIFFWYEIQTDIKQNLVEKHGKIYKF